MKLNEHKKKKSQKLFLYAGIIVCLCACSKSKVLGNPEGGNQPSTTAAPKPTTPNPVAAPPPSPSPIPSPTPPTLSGESWYNQFGQCLISPDDNKYARLWSRYEADLKRKVANNIEALDTFKIPSSLSDFVAALLQVKPILSSLDSIKTSAWMKKLYATHGFIEFTSTSVFLAAVEDPSFVSENHDPDFLRDYQYDATFKSAIDNMIDALRSPLVKQAISYLHERNLSFIDPAGLASALKLVGFFDSQGDLSWIQYVKDLPNPPVAAQNDSFGSAYQQTLKDAISAFLVENPVHVGGSIDQATASELNRLKSPVTTSMYDDYILDWFQKNPSPGTTETLFGQTYPISPDQIAAIDGVARTFWGEERGCETEGFAQFELMGTILANRAQAVDNALFEQLQINQKNAGAEAVDIGFLLGSSADASFDPLFSTEQMGLRDFGIAGSPLLSIVQVISRPLQFSVWNSFNTHTEPLSQFGAPLPAGIPNIRFTYQTPESAEDQSALIHVLCPQIQRNLVNSKSNRRGWPADSSFSIRAERTWRRAIDLASLLVVDRKRYIEIFQAAPKPSLPLMYYSDGVNLSFAVKQSVSAVTYMDPSSGKSSLLPVVPASKKGSCSSFQAFSSPPGTDYGVIDTN